MKKSKGVTRETKKMEKVPLWRRKENRKSATGETKRKWKRCHRGDLKRMEKVPQESLKEN